MIDSSILKTLFEDIPEEHKKTLDFELLNEDSIKSLKKGLQSLDIDYFLCVGKSIALFGDNVIGNLLNNFTGMFRKAIQYKPIYSATYDGVYVIGELGHYKIGIPIPKRIRQPAPFGNCLGEDEIEEYLNGMEKEEHTPLSNTLNKILSSLTYENKPYYQFKSEIVEKFIAKDMCVFAFGQKLSLDSFKLVVEKAVELFYIEIAIGLEFKSERQFISVCNTKLWQNFLYSNFLSNEAGNLLINDPEVSKNLIPNSFRSCVYNTFQHEKKKFSWEVEEFSYKSTDDKLEYLRKHFNSIQQKIVVLNNLSGSLDNTNIRIEGYFVVKPQHSLKNLAEHCYKVLSRLSFVKADTKQIKETFKNTSRLLLGLLNFASNDGHEYYLMVFALLYCNYIRFIFSLDKLTPKFIKTNFNVLLPTKHFNVDSKSMSPIFYDEVTAAQFFQKLVMVFGDTSKGIKSRTYFFTLYFKYATNLTVFPSSYYKSFINRTLAFVSDHCNRLTAENCQFKRTYVGPDDFLILLSRKYQTNILVKDTVTNISLILDRNAEVRNIFTRVFVENERYLIFANNLYVLQPECKLENNPIATTNVLGTLREIVKSGRINDIIAICSSSVIPVNDHDFMILNLYNLLTNDISHSLENMASYWRIYDIPKSYDTDMIIRLLFVTIPKENHIRCFDFENVIDIIQTYTDLIEWISIGIFYGNENIKNFRSFEKYRENFHNKLAWPATTLKISTLKILYCTGIYKINRRTVCGNRLTLPLPGHVKLCGLADPKNRVQMFKCTIGSIILTSLQSKIDKIGEFKSEYADSLILNPNSQSLPFDEVKNISNEEDEENIKCLDDFFLPGKRQLNLNNNDHSEESQNEMQENDDAESDDDDFESENVTELEDGRQLPFILPEPEFKFDYFDKSDDINLSVNHIEIAQSSQQITVDNTSNSMQSIGTKMTIQYDFEAPITQYDSKINEDFLLKKYKSTIEQLGFTVRDINDSSDQVLIQAILEITNLTVLTARAIARKMKEIFEQNQ